MGFTSSIPPALTAPLLVSPLGVYHPASDPKDVCPHCVLALGLCHRDDCRRQVLPQLARPTGLLRLIGEAHVEQTKRQKPDAVDRKALARIARRNARKVARSKRGGMFGLLAAIARSEPAK